MDGRGVLSTHTQRERGKVIFKTKRGKVDKKLKKVKGEKKLKEIIS
jgi:hypothetical protein